MLRGWAATRLEARGCGLQRSEAPRNLEGDEEREGSGAAPGLKFALRSSASEGD